MIPNPWDAGSAKMLAALGFKALATTSGGFAFTLGRRDGGVTLDEVCSHVAEVDAATPLPVSTDLENGYGPRPEDAAEAIIRAAGAGAVGGSIEDFDPRRRPVRARRWPRSAWRPRSRRRARSTSPSPSRRAPRTSFAAIPTWMTRSPGCRRSRGPARTCSTRRFCRRRRRWRRSVRPVSKPVNVLGARQRALRRRDLRGRRAADQHRQLAHLGRLRGRLRGGEGAGRRRHRPRCG